MRTLLIAAAGMSILTSFTATAQLFSENFELDPTAQWTENNGPSDAATSFFFDYGTVGIPLAPNSGAGGNHGLKLQANQANSVFSGVSVSPNGQNFPGDFRVQFDWWSNFNGPFPVGGSGSTQMSTFGIGTSGTVAQWPGGSQDSIWFAATGDGNSSSDWRAYSPTAPTRYVDTAAGIYAAGSIAGSSNGSDPYYSSFGSNSAPAAQLASFPQQTGTTLAGSAGMEWHQVTIERSGANVTWVVDGILIATVPLTDDTVLTGDNIFFGHSDTNATSSTDPNDGALLFSLIDNVRVIPEPSAGLLLLFGVVRVAGARRRGPPSTPRRPLWLAHDPSPTCPLLLLDHTGAPQNDPLLMEMSLAAQCRSPTGPRQFSRCAARSFAASLHDCFRLLFERQHDSRHTHLATDRGRGAGGLWRHRVVVRRC